jgi:peroxiredoxin (alkyl hydroperoxide reductase subunit C)
MAPHFAAKAVVDGKIVDQFSLRDFIGQYVIFFFYPLDFTFVCPTELHAFQERLPEFEKRNAQVIGCSVDSWYSHLTWLNTPKSKGGIEGIKYPLVSDFNKEISKNYHVLNEEEGVAYRGLFLIDVQGIVRHQLVNDLPLGRSIDEALRLLDALTFYENHGEVCPANWTVGAKSMKPTTEGLKHYFN